jgi:hypothetical protein
MSIIFLGTSNCIVAGSWTDRLKELTDEPVLNASLGASPSRLALYQLALLQLVPSDVVLLDYTVTEAIYQAPYWNVDESSITKDITSIVDYITRRQCHIIIMINPCHLGLQYKNVFEPIHIKIANDLGLPVLNVTELFRRTVKLGRRPQQLMRDNSHHGPQTALTVAKTIFRAVQSVREQTFKPQLDGQDVWLPRVILLAPLVPADQRLQLQSSLRSTEMALLKLGDRLHFDVKSGERLLGLVVNMAGRGGRVCFTGKDDVEIRDFIYEFSNDNPSAAMGLFAPMRTLLEGSERGLDLEVIPFGEDSPPPDIARPTSLTLTYDQVTIEGLLIGAHSQALQSRGGTSGLIDLLNSTYSEFADELFHLTSEAPACEWAADGE